MAINSSEAQVMKIVIGLFNAAPGKANFDALSSLLTGNNALTPKQVAEALSNSPIFTNEVLGSATTTQAKVNVLLGNFGLLPEDGIFVPTKAALIARDYLTEHIEHGDSIGSIIYDAVVFLSGTVPPEFADTAALLNKKAVVAEHYSVDKGLSAATLAELQQVLSKVTATTDVSTPEARDAVIAQGIDSIAPIATAPADPFNNPENATAATVLGTVTATDNKAVTGFEIASGNDAGFFAINAAGQITLTAAGLTSAANDWETQPNSFTLGVKAVDGSGNKSAAVDVVLNVTDVDDVAPALTTQVLSGNRAVLTFDEAFDPASVPAGSSFTVVQNGNTNIAVNSVSVSGQIVTLTLATAPAGAVSVSYTPPAATPLQDAAGNDVAAFANKTLTVDTTAPTLSSSAPADNGTEVAINSNLVLTFNETVQVGTGNIVITNALDTTDTRTIAITDTTQVTFNGSVVTVNPTADLRAGANYSVQIAPTAIQDAAGNAFAGIANATTLNFNTVTVPGQTFTLTTAIAEQVVGTDGPDTFNGLIGSNALFSGNTFNAGDTLNGQGGADVFNLFMEGIVFTPPIVFPAGAAVTGIETINLFSDGLPGKTFGGGGGFNAANFVGATAINQIGAVDGGVITNVGAGVTIGFQNTFIAPGSSTVSVAAGVTAANVVLTNVATGSTVTFADPAPVALQTMSVSGSVAGAGGLFIADTSGAATTLNLALTSSNTGGTAITVVGPSALTTINAAASTGSLTFAGVGTTTTLIGGSGNDTIIEGGAGTSVTGGRGGDTVFLAGPAATTLNFAAGDTGLTVGLLPGEAGGTADVIFGFNGVPGDVLEFGLAAGTAANFTNGLGSSSFVDGRTNANTAFSTPGDALQYFYTSNTDVTSPNFGNGYLFVDRNLDGTADEAIVLVGTGVGGIIAADIA